MTGCTNLFDFGKQCIVVAVNGKCFDLLEMTSCPAFDPKLLTASTIIGHLACPQCCQIRFFIHVSDHQDILCLVVLHNNRDQTV